jgi:hypothetical protein
LSLQCLTDGLHHRLLAFPSLNKVVLIGSSNGERQVDVNGLQCPGTVRWLTILEFSVDAALMRALLKSGANISLLSFIKCDFHSGELNIAQFQELEDIYISESMVPSTLKSELFAKRGLRFLEFAVCYKEGGESFSEQWSRSSFGSWKKKDSSGELGTTSSGATRREQAPELQLVEKK